MVKLRWIWNIRILIGQKFWPPTHLILNWALSLVEPLARFRFSSPRKEFPKFRLYFWTKYLRLIFKSNFHVLFSHAYTFEKSNLNEHFVDVFEIDWNIGWNTFQVLFRVMFGLTVIWFVSDPSVWVLIKNPRSTAVIGF